MRCHSTGAFPQPQHGLPVTGLRVRWRRPVYCIFVIAASTWRGAGHELSRFSLRWGPSLVCFDFCRTIPQMGYFGIINGDYCYCTPYFKSAESGSEICDIPCVGAPSLMCGGKTKSSVFEMHLCNDAADDLEAAG